MACKIPVSKDPVSIPGYRYRTQTAARFIATTEIAFMINQNGASNQLEILKKANEEHLTLFSTLEFWENPKLNQ